MISSNDNTRPRKKIKREDFLSIGEAATNKINEAQNFLFRSPALPEEINQIATKIRSRLEDVYEEIASIGFDAFRKKQNETIEETIIVPSTDDGEEGVDSDDEMANYLKDKDKTAAAMLQEAIVRGDPRRYQTALVELAKKRNTIVNLGTGQGKTLIALLLIRHYADQDDYSNGRQTLFLVPSVALAMQHTTTLMANLPYTVATACNNASVKASTSRDDMARANILVATHGAARDLFMHYGELFSFERINLLIVDECHYASGDHEYATIMRNFYHRLPREKRPRVLGLTASPLVNIKTDTDDEKLMIMLDELESIMDSKLASLPKLGIAEEDMGRNPTESEERCIFYHGQPSGLHDIPTHYNIGLHEVRVREFKQFVELYRDLGPKLTSIYSATVAREISINRYDQESKEQFLLAKQYLEGLSQYCAKQCLDCPNGGKTEKLAVLEQLLEDIIESKGAKNTVGVVFVERRVTALALYDYFRTRRREIKHGNWVRVRDTKFDRSVQRSSAIDDNWFAPKKIKESVKPRCNISSRQFQEMNFTNDELDAEIINNVLESCLPAGITMKDVEDLEPSPIESSSSIDPSRINDDNQYREIRCDMIVRNSTAVFKYLDRSHHYSDAKNDENWLHKSKSMKDVLDDLRAKRTNVLIATSVVEEGIDIGACSFVIVFDHIKSTKAYVQMKGRARQRHARFFVFQDTSPDAESNPYIHLHAAQTAALRVKNFIDSRPDFTPKLNDSALKFKTFCGDSVHVEYQSVLEGLYRTTKGFVDLSAAKTLLNRYTLSIPMERASRLTRDLLRQHLPHFEENRLILPAHIPSCARCVILPERFRSSTQREKQNMLSLMACVRLHKLHLLNDRLLPLTGKDMQEKLISVALTKLATHRKRPPQIASPIVRSRGRTVYLYQIQQCGKIFEQHDDVLGDDGMSLCIVSVKPMDLTRTDLSFNHVEIGGIHIQVKEHSVEIINDKDWDCCTKFHTVLLNGRWRKRTGSSFYVYNESKIRDRILPFYVVGCLTKRGLLDLKRMLSVVLEYGRNIEERKAAVKAYNRKYDLQSPRIVCPVYDPNVNYILYGPSKLSCAAAFPDCGEDVNTYGDYFRNCKHQRIDDSCILYSVQRQWNLPRKMQKRRESSRSDTFQKDPKPDSDLVLNDGERSPCHGLDAALLPIDLCLEAPIADASLLLHCLILPQLLFHIDNILTTQAFVDHCTSNLPILGSYIRQVSMDCFDDLLEALTAKSCGMDKNYDRLEFVGDAVLKLIHTDALLHSTTLRNWVGYLHEGDLTTLRSAMGSNERLMQASISSGLERYILFRELGRSQWIPSGLEMHEILNDGTERVKCIEQDQVGNKTKADFIESLLGLIYVKNGFHAARSVAEELGITLPRDSDYAVSIPGYTPNKRIFKVAEILGGIHFNHPELLEEALTHPTCTHEEVPCYQKLEWVGDAVLSLFARCWVFNQFPSLKVGELVILESTIVCNETLAYLCVSNGLQRYLNHCDPILPGRIETFEIDCKGRGLWATDAPKCLGDIVESVFGSVFVDAGLDAAFSAVNRVLCPVLEALRITFAHLHHDEMDSKVRSLINPKQYIHELVGGAVSVKSWKEEMFAVKKSSCPVWKDGIWGRADFIGCLYIGLVQCFGIDLIGFQEKSPHVARNRTCAIAMTAFQAHPELIDTVNDLSQLLRSTQHGDSA